MDHTAAARDDEVVAARSTAGATVWTIAHGIAQLADVRTVPRSRHNPQFNRETLPDSLAAAGIAYVHMPDLGGLRRPRRDSPNSAWRNASFRGYADYMLTEDFARALDALLRLAERRPTASAVSTDPSSATSSRPISPARRAC